MFIYFDNSYHQGELAVFSVRCVGIPDALGFKSHKPKILETVGEIGAE